MNLASRAELAALRAVATHLSELRSSAVFLGGMIRGLLITDPAASTSRPTDDVDVVVHVASHGAYYVLANRLRALGFSEMNEPEAPLCRWRVAGIVVDVMPDSAAILGFSNSWYGPAMAHAIDVPIGDELLIRVISAPYFCATKLEAFISRGNGDLFHADLEDVIAVVDGRPELLDELRAADIDVGRFVAMSIASLLSIPGFEDALPGHLPGDEGSQARLPLVLKRLTAIAALAT
jgi:predicted nucleotidyltransferase